MAYCKRTTKTHGDSHSRTYNAWRAIKKRCYLETSKDYYRYGERGITVCNRWINSYENFLSDMGKVPIGMSIDRIDNNGPYSPSNSRWATIEQQANNKRSNKLITNNGKTLTLAQWSRVLGGNASLVKTRLRKGWTEINAVSIPVRTYSK